MKKQEINLIVVAVNNKTQKPINCILEINWNQHTIPFIVCKDLYLSWNLNAGKSNDYFLWLIK